MAHLHVGRSPVFLTSPPKFRTTVAPLGMQPATLSTSSRRPTDFQPATTTKIIRSTGLTTLCGAGLLADPAPDWRPTATGVASSMRAITTCGEPTLVVRRL